MKYRSLVKIDGIRLCRYWMVCAALGYSISCSTCFVYADEGRSATHSLSDIYAAATERQAAIKNVRVTYLREQRPSEHSPNDLAKGKFRVKFAYLGEKRTRDRESLEAQTGTQSRWRLVYDGERGAEVTHGTRPSTRDQVGATYLEPSKPQQSDYCIYCTDVLEIPLKDKTRALIDKLYIYPHGLRDPNLPGLFCRVMPDQEMFDGAWCHVVEWPGYRRVWVDPDLGYAYRKSERLNGNKQQPVVESRSVLSNFTERNGVWLPTRFDRQFYRISPEDGQSQIWNEDSITVEEISINDVTDDDFLLTLPKGTLVYDSERNVAFNMPDDSKESLSRLLDEARFRAGDPPSGRLFRIAMIILGSALLGTVIYFQLIRKRST